MKIKLFICCVLFCVLLAGCLGSMYSHKKYDPITGKLSESWEIKYDKAMVTSTITDVNMVLEDGSYLQFSTSAFIYDGNDWIKMGKGISASGLPALIIP